MTQVSMQSSPTCSVSCSMTLLGGGMAPMKHEKGSCRKCQKDGVLYRFTAGALLNGVHVGVTAERLCRDCAKQAAGLGSAV